MYYIGIDYHKTYSYFTIINEKGEILREGRVMNNFVSVKKFVEPYSGEAKAVLESGRNWIVMHDWMEKLVDEVKLANPIKVKAIAEAKVKTDKIDAHMLAQLLRADLIPECHVSSLKARAGKNILRQRMFFIKLRTLIKNRIHTLFDRHPEVKSKYVQVTDWFGKKGRLALDNVKLPEAERKLLDRELGMLDDIEKQIKSTEKHLKLISKGDKRIKQLLTVPGIGETFAKLLVHEIDDIQRFRNHKKLAAYSGLVPSTYSSGGKTFNGRITKQGNKWIRWAMVEAVWPAVRKDPGLKDYYYRLKNKKGANKAKVAVARKLLQFVYKVLKEDRNFKKLNRPQREFRSKFPGRPHNFLVNQL